MIVLRKFNTINLWRYTHTQSDIYINYSNILEPEHLFVSSPSLFSLYLIYGHFSFYDFLPFFYIRALFSFIILHFSQIAYL